jgi:hypothetical protein
MYTLVPSLSETLALLSRHQRDCTIDKRMDPPINKWDVSNVQDISGIFLFIKMALMRAFCLLVTCPLLYKKWKPCSFAGPGPFHNQNLSN